jgi:hypothetical protein
MSRESKAPVSSSSHAADAPVLFSDRERFHRKNKTRQATATNPATTLEIQTAGLVVFPADAPLPPPPPPPATLEVQTAGLVVFVEDWPLRLPPAAEGKRAVIANPMWYDRDQTLLIRPALPEGAMDEERWN